MPNQPTYNQGSLPCVQPIRTQQHITLVTGFYKAIRTQWTKNQWRNKHTPTTLCKTSQQWVWPLVLPCRWARNAHAPHPCAHAPQLNALAVPHRSPHPRQLTQLPFQPKPMCRSSAALPAPLSSSRFPPPHTLWPPLRISLPSRPTGWNLCPTAGLLHAEPAKGPHSNPSKRLSPPPLPLLLMPWQQQGCALRSADDSGTTPL